MAHLIKTPKSAYYEDDKYESNIILNLLLVNGLACFIPYIFCYFYNLYLITELRNTIFDNFRQESFAIPDTSSITTQIELNQIIMIITGLIYFVIVIMSVILIVKDAKTLHVGAAYSGERFFRPLTWEIHSWGILTFFFWWFIFPLYVYRRKEIYEVNKVAFDAYTPAPLRAEG